MVLSLEELGPAVQQATHHGSDDTATAAANAAAQPRADLGQALQPPSASGQHQTGATSAQQSSAEHAGLGRQAFCTGTLRPVLNINPVPLSISISFSSKVSSHSASHVYNIGVSSVSLPQNWGSAHRCCLPRLAQLGRRCSHVCSPHSPVVLPEACLQRLALSQRH